LDIIQLDFTDNLPAAFICAAIECWEGQYTQIDMKGDNDFLEASTKLIENILSSFEEAEKTLLIFFFQLSKRAQMWLEIERPDDKNPDKLMQAVHECITKGRIIKPSEADLLFPPPQERSGDVNIDEASLVLHFLAHSLDPERISDIAPSFLNFAVTSQGIVIPEQQRRPLLKWCLEEGLPSILSDRQPKNISDYLYS